MSKWKIISAYDEGFSQIGSLSEITISRYCKRHSIDFEIYKTGFDLSRPPQWSKLSFMKKALQEGYDYVMWIDADAFFIKHTDIRPAITTDHDVFITRDCNTLNTGVWIVKNSEFTKRLLDKVDGSGPWDRMWWENGAFKELFESNWEDIQHKTYILPQVVFNSYPYIDYDIWYPIGNTNRDLSVIIHLPGKTISERLDLIKKYDIMNLT